MATDPIELLTADHRRVEDLLHAASQRLDEGAVNEIVKELSKHDAIETQLLYPTIAQALPRDDRIAQHALDDHQKVAEMLIDIDRRGIDDPDLPGLLNRLQNTVLLHVLQEEEQIFPGLRGRLDYHRMEDLGGRLQKAKKNAPPRPHPSAPRSASGAKLAAAMAGPMDRLRDKVQGRS